MVGQLVVLAKANPTLAFVVAFEAAVLLVNLGRHLRRSNRGQGPPRPGRRPASRATRTSHGTSLLDLPLPVLSRILSFVAAEDEEDLAVALLTCRTLQQAGEAVPRMSPLILTAAMLYQAGEAGRMRPLMAWLTRQAWLWQEVLVEVQSLGDLQLLLGRLAVRSGGPGKLALQFGVEEEKEDIERVFQRVFPWLRQPQRPQPRDCFGLPEGLGQLRRLTALCIHQAAEGNAGNRLPASHLLRLSSLTRLQSLTLEGAVAGPIPAAAFSGLRHLTSLGLLVIPERQQHGGLVTAQVQRLGSQHFTYLTGLRSLRLGGLRLSLSEAQALAAWQHLEDLQLVPFNLPGIGGGGWGDADFWPALSQLPCLTRLSLDVGSEREPSAELSDSLPPRLASLQLSGYSEPALPPLPPSLTKLEVSLASRLSALPMSTNLRSLTLRTASPLPDGPASVSAMLQLTEVRLSRCPLGQLPAVLASLPALEVLDLSNTELTKLPQDLACVTSLRRLSLSCNQLERVPTVLDGGAASRLEHLDLAWNHVMRVDREGIAVLSRLAALTYLNLRVSFGGNISNLIGRSTRLRRAVEAGSRPAQQPRLSPTRNRLLGWLKGDDALGIEREPVVIEVPPLFDFPQL